jgi:hypothetical protein
MLDQWYWVMPNDVLFSKDLTDKQKLLYCLISSLCAEKWYCRATNEYLWELLNADKWTISKNISALQEKWFINVVVSQKSWNQRKITLAENNKTIVKNDYTYSQEWQEGIVKNDNIIIQDNNTIEKKENKKEKFLEFVYLTKQEYDKLIDTYWEKVIKWQIENLNNYIWQKWKDKYKSHYYTILSWNKKAWIKQIPKKQENESWIYDLPF